MLVCVYWHSKSSQVCLLQIIDVHHNSALSPQRHQNAKLFITFLSFFAFLSINAFVLAHFHENSSITCHDIIFIYNPRYQAFYLFILEKSLISNIICLLWHIYPYLSTLCVCWTIMVICLSLISSHATSSKISQPTSSHYLLWGSEEWDNEGKFFLIFFFFLSKHDIYAVGTCVCYKNKTIILFILSHFR